MYNNINIRLMDESDLSIVLSWRNNTKIRSYMLTQHEITEQEHRQWFLNASQDKSRSLLIIAEKTDMLGFVQFTNVAIGGIADWGFHTNPEASKGSGYKLCIAALNYAFTEIKLHKVCGQVLSFNERSIALHKRLGFTQEGLLREQKLIDSKYFSIVCFGLINTEWTIKQI